MNGIVHMSGARAEKKLWKYFMSLSYTIISWNMILVDLVVGWKRILGQMSQFNPVKGA